MTLRKEHVVQCLQNAGFVLDKSSGFGDSFELKLPTNWTISAYAAFVGNPFEGNVDRESYEDVRVSLDGKGTLHIFHSEDALISDLHSTIAALTEVSQNPDLLKCPKCKTRFVHVKLPTPGGKQFLPFLSCDGMTISGSGRNKGPACSGTSRRVVAVVVHR